MRRHLLPFILGGLLCTGLAGCNAHGFTYYLFKPLWTKSLPHDIALGTSTPYIVLMEGNPSEWQYMNAVDERAMAQVFERHFREEVEHDRHAKPGTMDGEHTITIEAIRLQETSRTETREGQPYRLQAMKVLIDCIFRAPGMTERETITLYERESLKRKEREGHVECRVKNTNATFEDVVRRGADKAFAKYCTEWHRHRKKERRERKRAMKRAAKSNEE